MKRGGRGDALRTVVGVGVGVGAAALVALAACKRSSPSSATNAASATSVSSAADVANGGAQPSGDAAPSLAWEHAKGGDIPDLAALAVEEGAVGLVEVARADVGRRGTALGAMAYARGHAHLPFVADVVANGGADDARLGLLALSEIAARRRPSEDPEDAEELQEGCARLAALARDASKQRERRVGAVRAVRMLPCSPAELPSDLDAR